MNGGGRYVLEDSGYVLLLEMRGDRVGTKGGGKVRNGGGCTILFTSYNHLQHW